MSNVCCRCGDEVGSLNDLWHVGLMEGSVLFSDEKEYEEMGTLCYGCRWELEDWLNGDTFEDVDITVTVRG